MAIDSTATGTAAARKAAEWTVRFLDGDVPAFVGRRLTAEMERAEAKLSRRESLMALVELLDRDLSSDRTVVAKALSRGCITFDASTPSAYRVHYQILCDSGGCGWRTLAGELQTLFPEW